MKKLIRLLSIILLFISTLMITGCEMPDPNIKTKDNYSLYVLSSGGGYVYLNDKDITGQEINMDELEPLITNGKVKLIAEAQNGYEFIGWYDDNRLISIANTYSITLKIETTIKAVFSQIQQAKNQVNFLSINDTHGSVISDDTTTGMDKVATLIADLENEDGEYIKIANGDILQGSYFSNVLYGEPLIAALNYLDFDCFVIGNHEFDWGIETIARYKDGNPDNGEANFDFLNANIIDKTTNKNLSWTKPYTIVERNGFKIGIIGVIGEYLTTSIANNRVSNYTFLDPVPIVKNYAKELRTTKDCDIVVVAIHEYNENENKLYAELSGDSRIDAIFCGHTHQLIDTTAHSNNHTIPVVQSYANNGSLSTIELNLNNDTITYSTNYYYPRNYTSDNEMFDFLNTYYDKVNVEGQRVIGYNSSYLDKASMADLAANILASTYNTDLGIINYGGVRKSLSAGDITIEDLYAIFPFENYIYTSNVKGSKLIEYFEHSGSSNAKNEDFNVNNIVASKDYTVAAIDYVYTHVYNQDIFDQVNFINTNDLIREVMEEYYANK